jgi:hypothetical protein
MMQLNLMVLIFTILTFVQLRRSEEAAMLNVLLPALLLVPAIYYLRIPHLPPVSCYDAALLPLGVVVLFRHSHKWRLQRADLWVVGYALASFYTDYKNLDLKTAIYNLIDPGLAGGVLVYFIGKLMIEQEDSRERVARRVVSLLAVVGLLSVSEFVAKHNLFVALTHRFFGQIDYWGDQYRYGFLRVKGPFMGAEEAGIVFLIGFFLSLWLRHAAQHQAVAEPRYLGVRRSTLCMAGILLGLAMTLSRGPLLGVAAGYLIARVGLLKKKRLAIVFALLLIGAGAVIAHERAKAYARLDSEPASADGPKDEAKESATYRTRLYEVYEPIAIEGGLFGWSATAFPRDHSFWSIDNEYLLVWVAQGLVGLTLFVLILAEGGVTLVRCILRARQSSDICFYYCLAGTLVGLSIVLTTVFLTGQGYILFFLCSGWIQSLPDNGWVSRTVPQFAFRRVFTGAVP